MMPKHPLCRLAVSRVHCIGIARSRFIGFDKCWQNLLVTSMVVIDGVSSLIRPTDRFWPAIAHIMAFTSIVPSLKFHEVGLYSKHLPKSILKILLSTPVPVLRRVDMLVLQRRD